MKKSNKQKGIDFERKVEKCIASGGIWCDKGDLKTKDYVIEAKFTDKKGFRISTKLLKKLWGEALDSNKLPLLTIGIQDDEQKCLWFLTTKVEKK